MFRFFFKPFFRFEYQTISAFLVIILGTVSYHILEGWRWLDSLYFSVMTATTIGYGDFHPVTDYGKMFTMVYVIASIGVISSLITEVTQRNFYRTQKVAQNLRS